MANLHDGAALVGSWLHAFEEDEPGHTVFRRADWAFPPSRRPRAGLDLDVDGRAVELEPGPADRRVPRAGTWRVDGRGRLRLRIDGRPERTLEIDDAGNGRLVERS